MKNLLISGDTMQEWDVNDIIPIKQLSNKQLLERIEIQEIYDNRRDFYFNHRTELLDKIK